MVYFCWSFHWFCCIVCVSCWERGQASELSLTHQPNLIQAFTWGYNVSTVYPPTSDSIQQTGTLPSANIHPQKEETVITTYFIHDRQTYQCLKWRNVPSSEKKNVILTGWTLSCWKMQHLAWKRRRLNGSICSSKTSTPTETAEIKQYWN